MGETIKTLSVKQKKVDIRDILISLYDDIKNKLNFIEVKKEVNPEFGMRIFEDAIHLKADFTYNDNKFKLTLIKRTFKAENIIIETTLSSENDSKTFDDDIYLVKTKIKEVLSSYFKGVYWQKDTQNEKNCSELYEKIHILENRFREIIVQFMVNKYGFSWTKTHINKELNTKIIEFSRWYRENYSTFKNVKTELFNLQVNDLITLLQKAYDEKFITDAEVIQFIKKEDTNTTDILQSITDFKSSLKQLNVWGKYFQPVLGDNFNILWSNFNNMRNMVAHNKPICLELFNDTYETIIEIDKIFDNVIREFNKTFKSYEEIGIDDLYLELNLDHFEEIEYMRFEEANIELTPTLDEVKEQITVSEEIQSIIENSTEYISGLTGLYEEILEFIEGDFESNLDFTSYKQTRDQLLKISNLLEVELKKGQNIFLKEISIAVNNDDFESIWVNIKLEIEDYCNAMIKRISSSIVKDEFSLETPIVEINTSTNTVKIVSQGYIYPESGSSDSLSIVLVDKGIEIEQGRIIKNYGDYYINDSGAAEASHSDDLFIELNELITTYNEILDDNLNLIAEIRDKLFDLVE